MLILTSTSVQLNVAELQVSEKTDYKKRLEVLEEQQELIQDEKEQEEKEANARMAAKAKEQEEKEAALEEEEAAKAKKAEPEQVAEVITDQVSSLHTSPKHGQNNHSSQYWRRHVPRKLAKYKKRLKLPRSPTHLQSVSPRNSSTSSAMLSRFSAPSPPSCKSAQIFASFTKTISRQKLRPRRQARMWTTRPWLLASASEA